MSTEHPWEQGLKLSETEVSDLLMENIPDLSIKEVTRLGDGWDNTTWLINEKWVFRLPKHEQAAGLLLNEIKTLPNLKHLSITIPQPEFISLQPKGYPFPIYGHPYVEGNSIDQVKLTHEQRCALAEPLGLFLKKLHSFSLTTARKIGITVDSYDRSNAQKRFEALNTSFSYLTLHRQLDNADMFIQFYENNMHLPVHQKLVLGHGDLYSKHILLSDDNKLNAIIDWGDCELMSPAIDLRMIYQLLPHTSHETFWNAYGEMDLKTKKLALVLSIYSASVICWYAHQVDDSSLLSEGLRGLKMIEECL